MSGEFASATVETLASGWADLSVFMERYLAFLWTQLEHFDGKVVADWVLYKKTYMFVCVFMLRCLLICRNIRQRLAGGSHKRSNFWLHSLATCLLAGFGGSTLGPLLTGNAHGALANERAVIILVAAWFLVNYVPLVHVLLSERLSPLRIFAVGCAEVVRVHSVVAAVEMTMAALEGTSSEGMMLGSPLLGPILVGTAVGCGGQLLTRGLSVFRTEAPMVFQNTLLVATVYTLHAHTSLLPMDHPALGFLRGVDIRLLLMAHNGGIMIIRSVLMRAFNPYKPLHDVIYTLAFIDSDEGATYAAQPRRRRSVVPPSAAHASSVSTATEASVARRQRKKKVLAQAQASKKNVPAASAATATAAAQSPKKKTELSKKDK